jgi:hypothetical protein
MKNKVHYKSHVRNLFDEIIGNLSKDSAAIEIPLKVTYKLLQEVAQRSAELNDPILNELMMRLAMFTVTDPCSDDYDQNVVDQITERANEFRKNQKKKS